MDARASPWHLGGMSLVATMILGSLACGPAEDEARPRASGSLDSGEARTLTFGSMFWAAPRGSHAPQHHATVGVSADGSRLAVAWDELTDPPEAHVRTYDAHGNAERPPFLISTCSKDYPCRPDIVWSKDTWWAGWANDSGVQAVHFENTLIDDPVLLRDFAHRAAPTHNR